MSKTYNVLPLPHFTYSTSIENKSYTFEFRWLGKRGGVWHLDVYTEDGTPLCIGSKLVPYTPLLRRNLDKGPNGNLYVVKVNNNPDTAAGFDNIGVGKDFQLRYFSNKELGKNDPNN